MAKTRIEKIAGIDEEIVQLLAQKKNLLQEQKEVERKERTNRLCKRAGHLESLLPDTIRLTNERFNEFLSKTVVTDFAKRILRDLLAEQEIEAEIAAEESVAAPVAETNVKKPETVANTAQTQHPANAVNVNKQTA
jgi:hypothetical protein